MAITPAEIAETRGMVEEQNLDIRTITMGVSLMGCGDENLDRMCTKIYDHVTHTAEHLVETAENLEREYGIPIVNKRVSVTPVAQIAACCKDEDLTPIAHALDRAAETLGIDYLGGFSALVQKGIGDADRRVIQSIPQALATTSRVCSSVNVASLRAGINMDAVLMAAQTIIDAAKLTADQDSVGASKFVCFANMVEDSPFMAGAVHGGGEADAVINVGVSGPGVMAAALETLPDSASMMEVAEKIKQTAFKITRAGELMSREAAHRLGVEKGIVDLSLAPTPAIGDSVARILEIIGVGTCGGPGTTCALAMLNDAVKKGGVMASSSVGGLSGAFIPVSEDAGMIAAVEAGALSLEKLEAMTCVCSVGLDMIAIPGDTPVETIAGIIADEMAIGVINNKTTAVRVIPAIGKGVGDCVEYGGLFGRAPIMPVNPNAGTVLAHRGGRFPAPLNSLKNKLRGTGEEPRGGQIYKVACSDSPDSHGEHIKCSPARAELAIDLICLPPGGGAPAQRDLGWVLSLWQSLRFCPTLLVWRFGVGSVLSDICLLRLFFWEESLFCCKEVGPWLMGRIVLSCFLLIGMANGCVCKPIGGGLMILLSGIKGLDIFDRLRLLHMPGIL